MTTFLRRLAVVLLVVIPLRSSQAAPAFPIAISANSRYLVDQTGAPFPILGRTAWFVVSLSSADYRTFVDDTAARGYNAIELHVINHDPRGNHPPYNGNGDLPFLKRLDGTTWNGLLCCSAADFTTPNEPYWSFVDGFLAYCESKGILVFLFPAYVGYLGGDQGWMQEIVANGSTKMQSYGAWIATRYRNQKNLVWMMGGDMGTPPNTFNNAQTAVENALLTGLKSVPNQQSVHFSAEWDSESIATDQTSFGSQMTLNGAYSHRGLVDEQGRRAYAFSPARPSFLLEGPYDQEGPDGNGWNSGATQPVRRFQWWAWLSTIGGYISGNGYVWPFRSPDWQNHLDTQGSRDMAQMHAFIQSITWHKLVPSGLASMRTLVTSGGSTVGNDAYVAAAAAPDGTLLVAYIPPGHSGAISIDMAAMGGLTRARWLDPINGAYTVIGTGLANSGSRSFTPPGNNSAGNADWALVLDTTTGGSAPTISNLPDQTTTVNNPVTIPFTISDADTPVGNLSLTRNSSNLTLVPTNNIVFAGSGSSRTVTVTPANGQTGSATITVTVSDGANSASDAFVLTVNSVNTAPTITAISNQVLNEDTASAPLAFKVEDAETPAASLTLGKSSSNPSLVPTNNVVFGGGGTNRTVTVTPAANQNGTATITVTVSDGQFVASSSFSVTVTAVNDPPTITGIANQTINPNTSTGPLNFTVGDVDTAIGNLTLAGSSSNVTLVPTNNIVFGGSGANRTVTITPASNGQTGSATITVQVSDGQLTASTSFQVTVSALFVGTRSFTNNAAIAIPDQGAATPYPSVINVTGMGGTVSNVTVTLRNLNQTWGSDVDVLLVGPAGQKVLVMSDAGSGSANNVTLTLSDAAGAALPASGLASGTFRPTNYADGSAGGDAFPAPAPAAPFAGALSAFNGKIPNGAWSLYVFDDGPGDSGSFAGGWSLTMTTVGAGGGSAAPTISDIPNQVTTANTATAAIPFTIGDADTAVGNLTLSTASSNSTLVPTNNIVLGGSGTNRTITLTPASGQTGSATITVQVSDGQLAASTSFLVTVNSSPVAAGSFTNAAAISIANRGAASPYPSAINVTGMDGPVSSVTITLINLSHSRTPDMDVLLTGPGGQKMLVMSDAGSGGANNVTLTLSDGAASALPTTPLASGTFKPANYTDSSSGGDSFSSPAPGPPYASAFSEFIGQPANGVWSLYVSDDRPGNSGSIAGGWSIALTTASSSGALAPPAPLWISSVTLDAEGTVLVTVAGQAGRNYALEASKDLINWTTVSSHTSETDSVVLSDRAVPNSVRFYRVVSTSGQ